MFVGKNRISIAGARLGELLVEAGLVQSELVKQSLLISKNTKMPLGRVLVSHSLLSDALINCALSAQQGIRQGRFDREYAVSLIKAAQFNNFSAYSFAPAVAPQRARTISLSELGNLLLAAEILAEENLWSAQEESQQAGAPIGIWLAEQETLTGDFIAAALKIVLLCRESKLSYSDSILLLKTMQSHNLTLAQSAETLDLAHLLDDKRLRLAELLVEADVVNSATAIEAIELSLEKQQRLGEILMEDELISENLLEASLHLQEMANIGMLVREHASELLRIVQERALPLDIVLYDLEKANNVAQFIMKAGLVSNKQKRLLLQTGRSMEITLGDALLKSGLVKQKIITFSSYLDRLIENKALSESEAIGVLHYSLRYHVEPAEAIVRLGLGDSTSNGFDQTLQLKSRQTDK